MCARILYHEQQACSCLQVLTQIKAMRERSWCHAAIAIRMLFAPVGMSAAASQGRFGQGFFDAVATLIVAEIATLAHVLHCLSDSFDKLAKQTWTEDTFEAAVKTAKDALPTARVPTASAFKLDLAPFDKALEDALGAPPPLKLLLALLRTAPWRLCDTVISYCKEKRVRAVAAHRGIACAMLDRVAAAVQPLHAALFPAGSMGPCVVEAEGEQLPAAAPLPDEAVRILEVRRPAC